MRSKRAFALIYALLASVSFLAFFAAITYQVRGTLQTVRQSEDLVKARSIASLGNEVFFQLLKTQPADWVSSLPLTFSNEPGPDYFRGLPADAALRESLSYEKLGGYFKVELVDARTVSGMDLPPGGTYIISTCTAKVNDRQTTLNERSRLVLKLGNPYINNLAVSTGRVVLRDAAFLSGPIFVNKNEDGTDGHLDFVAHHPIGSVLNSGTTGAVKWTVSLDGEFQTQGDIRIVNNEPDGTSTVMHTFPVGSLAVGEEVTVPPTLEVRHPRGIGGVRAVGPVKFRPRRPFALQLNDSNDLFEQLESAQGTRVIDLDTLGSGVLSNGLMVEFEEDQVVIATVARRFQGRIYDLSLWLALLRLNDPLDTHSSGLLDTVNGDQVARGSFALKECRWDDPAYPNAPYPAELINDCRNLDVTGDGVGDFTGESLPVEGDFFDAYSLERGTVLQTIPLNRSDFTALKFETSKAEYVSFQPERPGEAPPPDLWAAPIFVRGTVKGKVSLAYELKGPPAEQAHWNRNTPLNRFCVLSDPGQSGVPGGVTLADQRVQLDPTEEDTLSEDMCLFITNGMVTGTGMPIRLYREICGTVLPSGEISATDFSQRRDVYAARLPQGSEMRDVVERALTDVFMEPVRFQAASMASDNGSGLTGIAFNGRLIGSSLDPDYPFMVNGISAQQMEWIDLQTLFPGSVYSPDHDQMLSEGYVIIPRLMREASSANHSYFLTEGAHGMVQDGRRTRRYANGEHRYDYRWRQLDADTLKQDLGLQVVPILIERRGL